MPKVDVARNGADIGGLPASAAPDAGHAANSRMSGQCPELQLFFPQLRSTLTMPRFWNCSNDLAKLIFLWG